MSKSLSVNIGKYYKQRYICANTFQKTGIYASNPNSDLQYAIRNISPQLKYFSRCRGKGSSRLSIYSSYTLLKPKTRVLTVLQVSLESCYSMTPSNFSAVACVMHETGNAPSSGTPCYSAHVDSCICMGDSSC